jgi:hypothetical protein
MLSLALAPVADPLAFGVHEHVAADQRPVQTIEPASNPGPTVPHHCELSVSVGQLEPAVELATPAPIVASPPDLSAPAPSHRPFVPLNPPRA